MIDLLRFSGLTPDPIHSRIEDEQRDWSKIRKFAFASALNLCKSRITEPAADLLFSVAVGITWSEAIATCMHRFTPAVFDMAGPTPPYVQVLVNEIKRNDGEQRNGLEALW
jgi:hypothetical protein